MTDSELERLIEAARGHIMTRREKDEQRVSFVYGNLPEENTRTKEQVRRQLIEIGAIADD